MHCYEQKIQPQIKMARSARAFSIALVILLIILMIVTIVLTFIYKSGSIPRWAAILALVIQLVSFLILALLIGAMVYGEEEHEETIYVYETPEERAIVSLVPEDCPPHPRREHPEEAEIGHTAYVEKMEQEGIIRGLFTREDGRIRFLRPQSC
jgi:hypothetical protein